MYDPKIAQEGGIWMWSIYRQSFETEPWHGAMGEVLSLREIGLGLLRHSF